LDAGLLEGWSTNCFTTRSRAAWCLDGQDWQLYLAEGRTPAADCQWWADRLGSRQAEWGRLAPQGSFTPLRQKSSGERFQPWGAARLHRSSRWRRIPAPLSKEDCSMLAYSATMRQGVDQPEPCWILGSWGCGQALLSPSTAAPPTPPPPRWHKVSTTLRRQPAAGTGRGWLFLNQRF
jgi:hypothetical protein